MSRKLFLLLLLGLILSTIAALTYIRLSTNKNNSLNFFNESQNVQLAEGGGFLTLYNPCQLNSNNPHSFLSQLEQNAPAFSALRYSLGILPEYDEQGNVIGQAEQILSAPEIILEYARFYDFPDPRLVAIAIEMQTQGLSQPNELPGFPLNVSYSITEETPYPSQVSGFMKEIMQRQQLFGQGEENFLNAYRQYFLDKWGVEWTEAHVDNSSTFLSLFQKYFQEDPRTCIEQIPFSEDDGTPVSEEEEIELYSEIIEVEVLPTEE